MNRFAMFTFATTAAAVGTVIAACSSDQGSGSQFYGTPCTDADGCGLVQDSGGGAALYGLPGPFDSGSIHDAPFDADDASVVDGDAGEDAD